MERCSNALQADWFHLRAACLIAPESVQPSVYAEAIGFCEKVCLGFSYPAFHACPDFAFQACSSYLKSCNISGAIAAASLAQSIVSYRFAKHSNAILELMAHADSCFLRQQPASLFRVLHFTAA